MVTGQTAGLKVERHSGHNTSRGELEVLCGSVLGRTCADVVVAHQIEDCDTQDYE